MSEDKKKPQISLNFGWHILRPDMRQYKQQSVEVFPVNLTISVDIDLIHENIANSEAILKAQLGSGKEPDPILTIAGMQQAMQAFESVLVDELVEEIEGEFEDSEEPPWDEGEDAPIDVTDEFADTEDNWEDEVETPDEVDDQSWEEDDGDDWS